MSLLGCKIRQPGCNKHIFSIFVTPTKSRNYNHMKKLFALFMILALCITSQAEAQQDSLQDPVVTETTEEEEESNIHYILREKFIEGDVIWMTPVLLCMIFGLAVAIERIITLSLSTINKDKFVAEIEEALLTGGTESAKELCRKTKGPLASIFYQGLDRSHEGIEIVEKTIISYGSVAMGQLEKGLIWISLFIALAPMLGFLGTVVGMIQSLEQMELSGNNSITTVAGGIKVALLTTVAGLIVAILLQVCYNFIVSRIDSIVNTMEEGSIDLVDILVKNKAANRPQI